MDLDKFNRLKAYHTQAKDYYDRYIKDCENPDTLLASYQPEITRRILTIIDGMFQVISDLVDEHKDVKPSDNN